MHDPFTTLGLLPAFDLDVEAAEKRHRELSRALHPDRYAQSPPAERRAALGKAIEVNEAWRTLRDPIRRGEALLRRMGLHVDEGQEPRPDPALLMEMMEKKEMPLESYTWTHADAKLDDAQRQLISDFFSSKRDGSWDVEKARRKAAGVLK